MIQRNNTSERLHNSNIIVTVWLTLKSNKTFTVFNSWIMQVCNGLTNKKDIKSIIHGSLQGGNKKPDWMKQQRNFTCNILFLSWKRKKAKVARC